MSGPMDNSVGPDAAQQLRLYVERAERLLEEKKALADDIKDVMAEAKGSGFNVAMIRYTIKMRAMEKNARDALLAEQETYLAALGLA